ncbi:dipeptide ABC transporter ATP-binding protein [Actinomadura sp. DSM 109109]|nr:dipeptide ABC transporter ATP-binding protein [Actinomadura lepetitiana]
MGRDGLRRVPAGTVRRPLARHDPERTRRLRPDPARSAELTSGRVGRRGAVDRNRGGRRDRGRLPGRAGRPGADARRRSAAGAPVLPGRDRPGGAERGRVAGARGAAGRVHVDGHRPRGAGLDALPACPRPRAGRAVPRRGHAAAGGPACGARSRFAAGGGREPERGRRDRRRERPVLPRVRGAAAGRLARDGHRRRPGRGDGASVGVRVRRGAARPDHRRGEPARRRGARRPGSGGRAVTVLRVEGLTVAYAPGAPAVRGAGLSVEAGEALGIVGESGAGKTALALALMGLLPEGAQVTGSVRLRGRELVGRTDAELSRVRGRDMAMVFQDPLSALSPVHTVGDQIAEAVRAHSAVSRAAARARAVDLLGLAGLPDAARRARSYPHELSGGMRQRVMIAMAVAHEPAVVVADEPTASLDVTVQARVLEVLRAAREASGAAILLITHDPGVAAGFADRLMVMHEGRVVETGTVEEVFLRPRTSYTSHLLRALPRTRDALVPRPRPERPVVLRVTGLVRHHPVFKGTLMRRRAGEVRAVDGVSFDVREGETLALVGESGSGKTTTLMEILRLARPQEGRVTVMGHDTAALRAGDRKALRRSVQVVFQDPYASLNPRMRVADIVAEPLTTHHMPIRGRVEELLALVGLEPAHARSFPHALSGGQRQRVALARALALEPRLLLLDEPVSALDAAMRASVMELLEGLREPLGLACLFVTHDLTLVRGFADRVAVMHLGRVVEIGPVAAVYGAPGHPYTRALLDAIPSPRPGRDRPRRFLPHGDPPAPAAGPSGCRFRPQCPHYATLTPDLRHPCDHHDPMPRAMAADHAVSCHHPLVPAAAEE